MPCALSDFEVPPYRFSGAVYSALMNHAPQLDALGEAVHAAPYKAPPRAPVLAVRPRNTLVGEGARVGVPAEAAELVLGASLAIVIGATACRLSPAQALDAVAGYSVAVDLSLPSDSHYRPAVRLRARDGFCPLSSRVVAADQVPRPDALVQRVFVDGALVQETSTGGRLRGVAQLVADVSEFMTLQPGDVLLLGETHAAPRARAGQTVSVAIEGLGPLAFRLVAEEGGAA